jgi:gluconolactonase
MVTIDQVRAFALTLPRTTEGLVRDRVKFRVGRIVYLAFSPDETVLYVGDNGAPHHLLAFDVEDEEVLSDGRVVATSTPDHPDGIKIDSEGRIYATSSSGVQIFEPNGNLVGEIELPGAVNFAFGAPEGNVLYITADTAIWAAVLNAKGG